ncbi:btb/poz domain-containing protein 19-like [Gigaspora margarita]|uniref:Btb/poz domain-containing protein 19-like n=2 Tax=Gigaspora margarita TaxID=4874 RepID=A0A8H3X813_GIGMA|nr:btb/poz domain-containing protein 19-like [Gigaspora margarita]KAF0424742.1 btb/poz domain-containing protein 19-like [Gigaspora margarita]
MSSTFFLNIMSRHYTALLESGDHFDMIIHAGQELDTREFKVHSLVLRARSTYFRAALSSNWARSDGNILIFNKPNVSPSVFEIILKYIYGASIDLPEKDVEFIIDVLTAAEELCLTELFDYIEDHILNNPEDLLNHFALVYHFATQHGQFKKLLAFCTNTMEQDPSIVFETEDFINIDQSTLISILKKKFLIMREIELWEKLVEWSIAQNISLTKDIDLWTFDDFTTFGNIVSPFIPHINFALISPSEFDKKVRPYKQSFGNDSYAQLWEYHLSQLNTATATLFQTCSQGINSKLITMKQAALICGWIVNDNNIQPHTIPFEFNLLVRGSRDGFGPKIFHEKCDLKGPSVTILKVHHSGELLGGFNPLNWEAHTDGVFNKTKKSFIFSLGNEQFNNIIYSKVRETKQAIFQCIDYGPCFGSDLALIGNGDEHWEARCLRGNYENHISPGNYVFFASEYEVFQIVRKSLRS